MSFAAQAQLFQEPPGGGVFHVRVGHHPVQFQAHEQAFEETRQRLDRKTLAMKRAGERAADGRLTRLRRVNSYGAVADQLIGLLEGDGDLQPFARQAERPHGVTLHELRRFSRAATLPALVTRYPGIVAIGLEGRRVTVGEAPQNKATRVQGQRVWWIHGAALADGRSLVESERGDGETNLAPAIRAACRRLRSRADEDRAVEALQHAGRHGVRHLHGAARARNGVQSGNHGPDRRRDGRAALDAIELVGGRQEIQVHAAAGHHDGAQAQIVVEDGVNDIGGGGGGIHHVAQKHDDGLVRLDERVANHPERDGLVGHADGKAERSIAAHKVEVARGRAERVGEVVAHRGGEGRDAGQAHVDEVLAGCLVCFGSPGPGAMRGCGRRYC